MRNFTGLKIRFDSLKNAGFSVEKIYKALNIRNMNKRFARYWGYHRNRSEFYFSEIPSGTKYFTSTSAFKRWFLRYYTHEAPSSATSYLMHRYDDDGTSYFLYFQLHEECT